MVDLLIYHRFKKSCCRAKLKMKFNTMSLTMKAITAGFSALKFFMNLYKYSKKKSPAFFD